MSNQSRDIQTMTLAMYRAFAREYGQEWITNEDAFDAVATELDLDVCEEIQVGGVATNAAMYRFRWAQQRLKWDGEIERNDDNVRTSLWRAI